MKIFVSSLISGFEGFRDAARSAIRTLRHEPVMAEDFGARPDSPQIACLQEVRDTDVVVLILGAQYGAVQGTSGLSPTHEEFREARDRKPELVFVQEGVQRELQQDAFVTEVQEWQRGYFPGKLDRIRHRPAFQRWFDIGESVAKINVVRIFGFS